MRFATPPCVRKPAGEDEERDRHDLEALDPGEQLQRHRLDRHVGQQKQEREHRQAERDRHRHAREHQRHQQREHDAGVAREPDRDQAAARTTSQTAARLSSFQARDARVIVPGQLALRANFHVT